MLMEECKSMIKFSTWKLTLIQGRQSKVAGFMVLAGKGTKLKVVEMSLPLLAAEGSGPRVQGRNWWVPMGISLQGIILTQGGKRNQGSQQIL
ncbi:hypothetical protein PR048_001849 [Dryococelus australis]|uniref:Uncharacterized protein n=1 Tax=Dryococelus australis TaxID=614101 RepID=A0ABQ9IIH5_9NEOP|nr:hypothetical protein PR048_001849 [Dryococelus australis]